MGKKVKDIRRKGVVLLIITLIILVILNIALFIIIRQINLRDNEAPRFLGLTDITVNKNEEPDLDEGVLVEDNADKDLSYEIDLKKLDLSLAGIYYIKYTATDLSGNETTEKRKITVAWDQDDINLEVDEFFNKYCQGKTPEEITTIVKEKISYSSTDFGKGDNAIYYGLKNGTGNCYVHAAILDRLLLKAGYSDKIIWLDDESHFWNYCNDMHLDSTPSKNHIEVAYSDEEKMSEAYMVKNNYTEDNIVR